MSNHTECVVCDAEATGPGTITVTLPRKRPYTICGNCPRIEIVRYLLDGRGAEVTE